MEKALNVKEFKWLIDKYQNITEEYLYEQEKILIEEGYSESMPYRALAEITGFNKFDGCVLCKVGNHDLTTDDIAECQFCVYRIVNGDFCYGGENKFTFVDIEDSETYGELIESIRERAKHMKKNTRKI